jgi:hypothetical protein
MIPGNLYFFWGYRTVHANEACDPDKIRATALWPGIRTLAALLIFAKKSSTVPAGVCRPKRCRPSKNVDPLNVHYQTLQRRTGSGGNENHVNPVVACVIDQRLVHQYLSPTGDTYWVQTQNALISASGTVVSTTVTASLSHQVVASLTIMSFERHKPLCRYVSPATALHTKRNVITLRIPSMKWSRYSVTNA